MSNQRVAVDELRNLAAWMPNIAALALFCKMAKTETTRYAMTDGVTIYVGTEFFSQTDEKKRFILGHELLHVALQHPNRARRYARDHIGHTFNAELWNIAGDCIINAALEEAGRKRQGSYQAPEDVVSFEAEKIPCELHSEPIEAIYEYLCSRPKNPSKTKMPSLGEGGCCGNPLEQHGSADAQAEDALSGSARSPSLDEDNQGERARWDARLASAFGSTPNVLQRIAGDMNQTPRDDWRTILKRFLRRAAGNGRTVSYARPHRRTLALMGHLPPPLLAPYLPMRTQEDCQLAVIVDTSGSINEKQLSAFCAELVSLATQTRATTTVYACDAACHDIGTFSFLRLREALSKATFPGGGGTDFAPALARAAARKPKAIVYLTDTYGTFGPDPGIPVIWATTTPISRALKVPFGTLIEITCTNG